MHDISRPERGVILFRVFIAGILLTAGVMADIPDQPESSPILPGAGPDYGIETVCLPKEASFIGPGSVIRPSVTILNSGGDDPRPEALQMTGSLDGYPLIPQNGTVSPLTEGEQRKVSLAFQVPRGIPPGEYTLIITLHPGREGKDTDLTNNQAACLVPLRLRMQTPGVKVSPCACAG